jgi:exodeoxyribonuclease VII large subunit
LLPQRIAIISVETSKGLADFLKVLEQNPWNYKFFHFLFPALLQGDRSVSSIIYQLRRIRKVLDHFDIVAIVRGGGGDVGLSSYNNYSLAREIALFPIPVFTGIGHSTNETVAEMISHRNAITPTALADFLIQRFHDFSVPLHAAEERLVDLTNRILDDEKISFNNAIRHFRSATGFRMQQSHHALDNLSVQITHQSKFRIQREGSNVRMQEQHLKKAIHSTMTGNLQQLVNIERHISILDPVNVLRRGYSITMINGKSVQDIRQVKKGDIVTTIVANGKMENEVKRIEKEE